MNWPLAHFITVLWSHTQHTLHTLNTHSTQCACAWPAHKDDGQKRSHSGRVQEEVTDSVMSL